jgi:hypothetical protein
MLEGIVIGLLCSLIVVVLIRKLIPMFIKDFKYQNTVSAILFILFFCLAKTFLLPYYFSVTLPTRLEGDYPVIQTLAKKFPNNYKLFIKRYRYNIENNSPKIDNDILTAVFVQWAISVCKDNASDSDIYKYLKERLKIEKEAFSKNPYIVIAYLDPNSIKPSYVDIIKKVLPSDYIEMTTKSASIIVNSVKSNSSDKISDRHYDPYEPIADSHRVTGWLIDNYGYTTVNSLTHADYFSNPDISAKMLIESDEKMIELGEHRAAALFRFLS